LKTRLGTLAGIHATIHERSFHVAWMPVYTGMTSTLGLALLVDLCVLLARDGDGDLVDFAHV
jgi:hypothetical protein